VNLAIPVPGLVRARPVGAAADDPVLARLLGAMELPDARLELSHGSGDPARGRVDHVLFIHAASSFEPEHVVSALRLLRRDMSTAAVGLSPTGAPAGSLEHAVSGDLMLVRADALRGVGGWERSTTGAFDDLDLCTRLWMAGHRVRSVGAPGRLIGSDLPVPIREEACLRTLATVLDDEDVADAAWAEPTARAALHAHRGRRAAAQRSRRRGTGELMPQMHRWAGDWAASDPAGREARAVLERWGAPGRAAARRRILVATTDHLAPAMAGPGIRAVAVARALSPEHDVVLCTTSRADLEVPGVEVRQVGEDGLEAAVQWCDVVVFQGWVMAGRPWLRDTHKVVVADVYDPMHLEQLEQGHEAQGERGRYDAVRGATATLNEQLRRADLVLCASAKQRDFWLGALGALGRINAVVYDGDPSLRRLLAVAPFGVPDEPFPEGAGALKGHVPGIGVDDKVILWGGGVYNWFDPLTLVRAIDRLRHRVPEVRLYFLGLGHPNPDVPDMQMVAALRRLVAELGLDGTHVFYNDGWVRFDERADYLRDADVGVSTHLDHVETEFSFRTRILDYLWAGLPIVATAGDAFGDLIEERGAGRTVPPGDTDALEAALLTMLDSFADAAAARRGSQALGEAMRWSRSLQPLVAFCRSPQRAPDVACPTVLVSPDGAELRRGLGRDLRTAHAYLRAGGVRLLVDRVMTRVRRVRGQRQERT